MKDVDLYMKIDFFHSSFGTDIDLMQRVNGDPNRWGSNHYQIRCTVDYLVYIGDVSPSEAKEFITNLRQKVIQSLSHGDYPFHGWLFKLLKKGEALEKRYERLIDALVNITYCLTLDEFITEVLDHPELIVIS